MNTKGYTVGTYTIKTEKKNFIQQNFNKQYLKIDEQM